MTEAGKAVFLSYASQDAEAAKRICDALRGAGVEVWFDQSELRGGDSWDAKIRKLIKECAVRADHLGQHPGAAGGLFSPRVETGRRAAEMNHPGKAVLCRLTPCARSAWRPGQPDAIPFKIDLPT
jgi:hypothetical protein